MQINTQTGLAEGTPAELAEFSTLCAQHLEATVRSKRARHAATARHAACGKVKTAAPRAKNLQVLAPRPDIESTPEKVGTK